MGLELLRPRLLPLLLVLRGCNGQRAHGPVRGGDARYANVGWATEFFKSTMPTMEDNVLRVQGNTRVYLVQDWQELYWDRHEYVRLDLRNNPLTFTIDLSNVPCGCLACVYRRRAKPLARAWRLCSVNVGRVLSRVADAGTWSR